MSSVCSETSDYEPEYEIETFTVGNGGGDDLQTARTRMTFELLCVVPPPLEFMSTLHSQQQEISGRQVWCGSLLLANFLIASSDSKGSTGFESEIGEDVPPVSLEGKRVLELGSGTGLVGMVASRLGSLCVALTDGDEEAITLLQNNLLNQSNRLQSNKVAAAHHLMWGDDHDDHSTFCSWCRSNWPDQWQQNPQSTIEFDTLLAGDVLYKKELPPLFFASVQRFMREGGELFLCHIPRSCVTHDVVIDAAIKAGFCMQKIDTGKMEKPKDCPVYDFERAAIYRITRQS